MGFSDVYAGNHNDLYNISGSLEKMLSTLNKAGIPTEGLFCNADAGFDSKEFKRICYGKDIFLNVDKNKRNGQKLIMKRFTMFLTKNYTRIDLLLREQTHGWIHLKLY